MKHLTKKIRRFSWFLDTVVKWAAAAASSVQQTVNSISFYVLPEQLAQIIAALAGCDQKTWDFSSKGDKQESMIYPQQQSKAV